MCTNSYVYLLSIQFKEGLIILQSCHQQYTVHKEWGKAGDKPSDGEKEFYCKSYNLHEIYPSTPMIVRSPNGEAKIMSDA